MDISVLETREGWTPYWSSNKLSPIGPAHWARWDNAKGYTVGEVDAGLYVATDPSGEGLEDENGQCLEWRSPVEAMAYIDALRPTPQSQAGG